MLITRAEKEQLLVNLNEKVKRNCEKSLASFCRAAWHIIEPGTKLHWNWHLDTVCGYLQAFHDGTIEPRLIINIPPGTLKSILVSVMFPAYCWINSPDKRFLTVSNEQGLSTRDARRMKQIITSDWFQSKWPLLLETDQNEKTLFANEKKGFRQAVGITASNTGKRGDCLIGSTLVYTEIGNIRIDDLCSMDEPPLVYSFNHSTKLIELKRILANKKTKSRDLAVVSTLYSDVICTQNHKIFNGKEYVKAKNINGCKVSELQRAGEFAFQVCDGTKRGGAKNKTVNIKKRQSLLCCLFDRWKQAKKKFIHASHRRRYKEQRPPELSYSVRQLPHEDTQKQIKTRESVASCALFTSKEDVIVYDIQVEDNSNFFANGILVHNCLILDDLIAAKNAFSDPIRNSVNLAYDQELATRLNDPVESGILLIMQRLHEADITGHLLKKSKTNWTVLSIPMKFENIAQFDAGKDIGRPELNDPRKKKGELLFPERFTKGAVDGLEEDLGEYGFAGQMQQRPVPSGGGIIKSHWWRMWPDDKRPPHCEHVFLSYDTAFSERDMKNAAYSAMTRWGVFWNEQRERYCLICLGRWFGRVGYDELRKMAKEFEVMYEPDCHLIEKKATGISLIQDLKRAVPSKIRSYSPGKGEDKISRGHSVSPMFESGLIYIPNKAWALKQDQHGEDGLIDYVAKFPSGAPPCPDLFDTVTMACIYLRAGYWLSHPDDPDFEEPDIRKREAAYG